MKNCFSQSRVQLVAVVEGREGTLVDIRQELQGEY